MNTADVAADLARCTCWSRDAWLRALVAVPAYMAGSDRDVGQMIADLATSSGGSPAEVVAALWPPA